jgi:hypothetical protein
MAVACGTDWLFIEVSMQGIDRRVAVGDLAGIDALCKRYHDELDQAEASSSKAADLAKLHGLPRPTSVATMVVVDTSMRVSALLIERLRVLRPERKPLFLVNANEFEDLAVGASRGWSMPRTVVGWQQGRYPSLEEAMYATARYYGRPRGPAPSVEEWLMHLQKCGPAAA